MNRDRSVAFLVTASGVAGAQRQVRDLALAMHHRGWRVSAISMLPLDEMFEGLPEQGVATHSLGMSRGIPDPRAAWRLRSLLGQLEPAVLHAHMIHAILLARVTRLSVRIPAVVSTLHSQQQGGRWRYVACRATDRLSDLTTTVSGAARDEALRMGAAPRGRIVVMPNGIEAADLRRDPHVRTRMRESLGAEGEFLWLAAGRMTEAKDYPNMIAAFGRLEDGQRPPRLLIAGTGELEKVVVEQIRASGLEDRITLLGHRSDVMELMQAADAFVMSSAWEGLPMALLEAGAMSLPVVATDVGGSHEVILDGRSGLIAPTRDPAALAQAMQRVMAMSDDERAGMGTLAREHIIATFDMDSIAARWDEIYAGLLSEA